LAERFDVVVVGARCAGSPLAALLAGQGLKVALVERVTFPRDTLSTHVFEAPATAFLDRLGVTDKIRATGTYFTTRTQARIQDVEFSVPWPLLPGDLGGAVSVRRFVLDPILVDAAADAGAEVLMAANVTGVVEERGRVAGVRVVHDAAERLLKARLVVGADGRNSTVAGLVGARKYNVTLNQRLFYYTYFENAQPGADPPIIFHRWDDRFVVAQPCDGGLYQVGIVPELRELPRFRGNLEGSFMEHALSCAPVAEVIAGARRVAKFRGILRFDGFFREASGPGWVLAGDAGHFKDPSPARGIADAFLQADTLAPAIVAGLDGSGEGLDPAMARWGRWRDREFAQHYWFAHQLGKSGPLPTLLPELISRLLARGKINQVLDLFNHRTKPLRVFSPPRVLGATARTLARPDCDRRALLREVGGLIAEQADRQRLNWRPEYVAAGRLLEVEATDIEDAVTVL
jgi:flavin-dependent dehydrogenase